MEDPNNTLIDVVEGNENLPQYERPSRSVALPDELNSREIQLCKNNCKSIPRHRFEIEGETFIIAQKDDAKPKTVQEALSSSDKKEWKKSLGR